MITVNEAGKLGGKKRAEVLSPERRKEISALGGRAGKGKKKPRKNLSTVILESPLQQ